MYAIGVFREPRIVAFLIVVSLIRFLIRFDKIKVSEILYADLIGDDFDQSESLTMVVNTRTAEWWPDLQNSHCSRSRSFMF